MTQVLWSFGPDWPLAPKKAVEGVPPFILWLPSRRGRIRAERRTMEITRMNSRNVAGLLASATIGCSIATADCTSAKAQFRPDPDRSSPGLIQRLFGSYSSYPMRSSPIPRTLVGFPSEYRPGNIVIDTSARRLYLVTAPGQAISYGIGVGRDGFTWAGTRTVSMKREWPDWTPPSQMLHRRPDLPRHMVGGIENPLGARALYLGSSLYRIHGSNEPETIGQAVSSGCFRMTNEDVIDLYDRVRVGTKVVVLH
jgi:lipoprotein-anchoring transpeptidase ErfK/SrfK